jgi:hypothetical protein
MLSGLPVILSDAILGRLGMIDPAGSSYIYPSSDSQCLDAILKNVLSAPGLLEHLKEGVRRQMESWQSSDFLDSWISAIDKAKQIVQESGKRNS